MEPITLTSKVFETLLYLVEHRGELVEKATLMKAIWPNVVVEENNLTQNISALRRALGETALEHRFIVTVPGRGYRFVAEVRTLVIPGRTSAQQQPATEASMAPSTTQPKTASSRSSIAVLPFVNLTGDPAKEYFSDGLAEELFQRWRAYRVCESLRALLHSLTRAGTSTFARLRETSKWKPCSKAACAARANASVSLRS